MISNHVSGVAVKITRKSGQEDFKLVAYNRCPLRQVWLYAEYGAKKRGKNWSFRCSQWNNREYSTMYNFLGSLHALVMLPILELNGNYWFTSIVFEPLWTYFLLFVYYNSVETSWYISSETTEPILIEIGCWDSPWIVLLQNCFLQPSKSVLKVSISWNSHSFYILHWTF